MKQLSPMLLWFIAIFFSGIIRPMIEGEKIERKRSLSRSGSYSPDIFYDAEDGIECSGKILAARPFVFIKTNTDGTTEGFRASKSLAASNDSTGRRFKDSQGKVFTLYGIKKLESNQ